MANSVDRNEVAHNEPPHRDLHCLQFQLFSSLVLRPDFTSKLVHVLAFGTPKFYIVPYDKIKHELVNLSSNCDVKSGLEVLSFEPQLKLESTVLWDRLNIIMSLIK